MSVLIKRYQNRKFYNTVTKRYITLSGIKQLITDNRDVRVIDNSTDSDITSATLSQILYEMGKKKTGILSIRLLIDLVQLAGRGLSGIHQDFLFQINAAFAHDVEIERRVNVLIERGDVSQETGTEILEKLVNNKKQFPRFGATPGFPFLNLFDETQFPTKKELTVLMQKVEDMSQRLDMYGEKTKGYLES